MITFKVDNVRCGVLNWQYGHDNQGNFEKLFGRNVESKSMNYEDNSYTFSDNNLIAAINTAYGQHLPLTLSPDHIWLTIVQGLSAHVNNNAEKLRNKFVDFDGKKTIEVFENSFVKGNPDNNWQNTFGQFSKEIEKYIGKQHKLIVADFTTTTSIAKAANEIVLMEAMQKYFDYECTTLCGIPNITLLGSSQDWIDIQNRVNQIAEFDLSWWTDVINPIIDEFIHANNGVINSNFWKNIFKESNSSGGPYISGWITNFYPYLVDNKRHNFVQKKMFGLTSRNLPLGLSKCPFKWNYYEDVFNMELVAGFTGFKYNDEGIIPEIGWVIKDNTNIIEAECNIIYDENLERYELWHLIDKITYELKQYGAQILSNNINKIQISFDKNKLNDIKSIHGIDVIVKS